MVKQSTPRTFANKGRSKSAAVNSGIFSNGTRGQKSDLPIKPSCGGKSADRGTLKYASGAASQKPITGGDYPASKLQKYALKGK